MTVPSGGSGRRRLVPAYLATDGSARASRNTLDRLTVLTATAAHPPADLTAPAQRILQLLRPGALTLAEVAAYLRLPVSIIKVLVSDLVDRGFLTAHASMLRSGRHDKDLLERVLHGLRAQL